MDTALPLQQFTQQALGGPLVAPALGQYLKHRFDLAHGAPRPMLQPGDLDGHLVEVSLVASAGHPSPEPIGELLAEVERPLPHRLVADDDAAPRAASISSTMRKLSGNRRYSQVA